jgi:GNAT superfamily N-acetyltransferase
MNVRKATPQDSIELTVLVKQFVKEAKYTFSVDTKMVMQNFERITVNPTFFVHVAENEGDLVGFLVGCVNTSLFSQDLAGIELGWYLDPEHRDGKTALVLLKQFEDWCSKKKCTHISLADIDTLRSMGGLYERKGYTLTEKTYVKEI